jgi:Short C-terminal domain
MRLLSPAGQQAVNDLAQRHGFSPPAVLNMLEAIINGNGRMAQFNHPEFSGSGQWMQGGMIMVSDMFNNYLKGRIDGLCHDLSNLVVNQPDLIRSGGFQSQSQGSAWPGGGHGQQQSSYGGGQQQQNESGPVGPVSLFVPPAPGDSSDWWGPSLRWPDSTGAQNGVRYAYFAQARRLAIEVGGKVTIHDTLDHQIGGFSQQQSSGGSLTFSSQYGLVEVARLPILSVDGIAPPAPAAPMPTPASFAQPDPWAPASGGEGDIFARIERLAELHAKGILSHEEFAAKKAELLSRI